MGHFGVRIQHRRCAPQLSVSRVRRSRTGTQARSRRGPRHCTLRFRAGADGCSRGGMFESAAASWRGDGGQVWILRSGRLHAVTTAARRNACHRSLIHGASSGDEPAFPGAFVAGTSDAAALRVRPSVPGDDAASPGANSTGSGLARAHRRTSANPRSGGISGDANAHTYHSRHTDPGSTTAIERPLPRHGHQRGWRQQSLEGPLGDPMARRQHLRQLGQLLLPARCDHR